MKARMLTGAVGSVIFILIMFFFDTLILNFSVSLVCFIMVYEIFHVTKMIEKSYLFFIVSAFYAALFPFLKIDFLWDFRVFGVIFYFLFSVFLLLKQNLKIKVYDMFFCAVSCFFCVLIMSNILYIRLKFYPYGMYYVILFFLIAWICDAGAYFVGIKFGKTKLAPKISPKKTVEGAVGGVFSALFFVFAFNYVYVSFFYSDLKVNYVRLFFVTILGAFFSIVGDLSVSVFKRQQKIKDFGDIVRGHGGVLDRFDSWLFVCAILYPIVKVFPIILI